MVLAGAVVLLLAVGLVALMVGRPSSASSSARAAQSAAEGSADAGFARDMAIHHQQAVEMSFIVRDRTEDEDVRRLAYDIINTQANQRGMMLGWLEQWGLPKSSAEPPMTWMGHTMKPTGDGSLMPGMATTAELKELKAAEGKAAEVLFLQLMTVHHRAGVDMARAGAEKADTDVIRNLAKGMVNGQESEIGLMATMLKARGAQP
ncbi:MULTISPECIES: DUF305 domain-containing protein [unclassified Streptomyces]|nr:DUF305 domain-containing protein [Streptomyces sp. COG21]MBT3081466.1 DUF305 domain-containing protein [Streptomyces sp. COG20]MBT3089600.1 DUF305 domain-containing protein [Streptomyces sp. CYG21]MBT3096480.1 DUF305 domain-containing protein [Streptomyces sp. CBG30]MBT3103053.1 DUF305 domain-containing protein [Streptomyces sp. COG19]MBT3114212.1 DUF305 domain-containing protein [Streptomyces sp. CYG20]RST24789.1 DUF305 domain-containing protein [Streptomyces sp. WAC04770]